MGFETEKEQSNSVTDNTYYSSQEKDVFCYKVLIPSLFKSSNGAGSGRLHLITQRLFVFLEC